MLWYIFVALAPIWIFPRPFGVLALGLIIANAFLQGYLYSLRKKLPQLCELEIAKLKKEIE